MRFDRALLLTLVLAGCDGGTQSSANPPASADPVASADPSSAPSAVVSAAEPAASAATPWMAPEPDPQNRQAYFAYLMKAIPQTLERITCTCCDKSLMRCYQDMGDPQAAHRCPYG